MENNNINLLDLGDDILNIIGDYVKKDNHDRYLKELAPLPLDPGRMWHTE